MQIALYVTLSLVVCLLIPAANSKVRGLETFKIKFPRFSSAAHGLKWFMCERDRYLSYLMQRIAPRKYCAQVNKFNGNPTDPDYIVYF